MCSANLLVSDLTTEKEESSVSVPMNGEVETVFPAPDLILNELYQVYQAKSNILERNSAIMDYLRLIFHDMTDKSIFTCY